MNAWRDLAFAAYQAKDEPRMRSLLRGAGDAVERDTLGLQLLAIGEADPADERAILAFAALEQEGLDGGAFYNLAVVEERLGLTDRALLRYEQALRLSPGHAGALINLSDLLRRKGRHAEAWRCLEALRNSGHPLAGLEIRFAKVADALGLAPEARRWFEAAVRAAPGSLQVVWEAAMQQLRDEDWRHGWLGYEARRSLYHHSALGLVDYDIPEWDGRRPGRAGLLVHKEQGLGDTIMFASCLPDIAPEGAGLHLAVQPPLARLFRTSFPKASVWPSVSTEQTATEAHQSWRPLAGPIGAQVPFGTLPLRLRRTGFRPARAYLRADEADRAVWRRRLEALAPRKEGNLRVGLVVTARRDGMAGPGVADGLPKSMDLRAAARLAVPGVTFVGLHDSRTYDSQAGIPAIGLVDTSDWLSDLADTAALIAELDLVVAVDTAVAHLAGALGRKVLLMLRRDADWRWGRTRTDSYWYEDVEVFRQCEEGDWWTLADTVAARLAELRSGGIARQDAATPRRRRRRRRPAGKGGHA